MSISMFVASTKAASLQTTNRGNLVRLSPKVQLMSWDDYIFIAKGINFFLSARKLRGLVTIP